MKGDEAEEVEEEEVMLRYQSDKVEGIHWLTQSVVAVEGLVEAVSEIPVQKAGPKASPTCQEV